MAVDNMWVVVCKTQRLVRRKGKLVRGTIGTAYRFVTVACTESEAIEKVRLSQTTLDESILREVDEELLGWSATMAESVVTLQAFTGPVAHVSTY